VSAVAGDEETPSAGAAAPAKVRLAAFLAAGLIRGLRTTVRLRFHGDEEVRALEREDRRFLLAFWHRHLLFMPFAYRGRRISVLVSRSRDGELISRAIGWLGIATARGSSSRGGAMGLRALLQQARQGYDIAFTPDGPRGPRGVVQPGVVLAARSTGWPVVPAAWAASRSWQLRSWDAMLVPKPGATVHVVFGPAWVVTRENEAGAAAELKRRLDEAFAEAEHWARGAGSPGAVG